MKRNGNVIHFMIDDNKNYGEYSAIVNAYIEKAKQSEEAEQTVAVEGTEYKVLKREKVTVFYNASGNTLFDVDNDRLKTDMCGFKEDVPTDNVDFEGLKKKAVEKLEKEKISAKDKNFAEPILGYLIRRCKEDSGLADDVLQEHKTWKKCFDYIFEKARKQASGNCAAIRYEVVYEWAEDYYHRDDKAEEEKKAKEAEERKKKAAEQKKKAETQKKANEKKEEKPAPKKKEQREEKKTEGKPLQKKKSNELEGQMDLFSMMGL